MYGGDALRFRGNPRPLLPGPQPGHDDGAPGAEVMVPGVNAKLKREHALELVDVRPELDDFLVADAQQLLQVVHLLPELLDVDVRVRVRRHHLGRAPVIERDATSRRRRGAHSRRGSFLVGGVQPGREAERVEAHAHSRGGYLTSAGGSTPDGRWRTSASPATAVNRVGGGALRQSTQHFRFRPDDAPRPPGKDNHGRSRLFLDSAGEFLVLGGICLRDG